MSPAAVLAWEWLPILLLVVVGAFLAWREPRRLLPGLLLTFAAFRMIVAGVVGAIGLGDLLDADLGPGLVLLGFVIVSLLGAVVLGVFLIWNTVEMFTKEGHGLAASATAAIGVSIIIYVLLAIASLFVGSLELVVWLMFLALPLSYLSFVFVAFVGYSLGYGAVTRWLLRPVDAVIVLGSGLSGGERVTPLLANRIKLGRRIYDKSRQSGRSAVLIPSGGRGSDEKVAEAEAMSGYLSDLGVPSEHIMVENRSTDTRENLAYSARILESANITGPVAVATSSFHAFRAATLMRDVGIAGYSAGAPTAGYYWPSATVREFLAILRDHLRINLVIVTLLSIPVIFYTVRIVALLFS